MLYSVVGNAAGLTIAATTYTSGDQLGTEITFTNAVHSTSSGALIRAAYLIDQGDVLAATDLVLFSAATTPAADNAAATWSDADALNSLGVISWATGDVLDIGVNRVGTKLLSPGHGIWLPTLNLYGNLITRSANAVFSSAADVRIKLILDDCC